MSPKAFILYPNQWQALKELSNIELGELMSGIFRSLTGEKDVEKQLSGRVILAYRFMMLQIDIDIGKYEKLVEKRRQLADKKKLKSLTDDLQSLTDVKRNNNTKKEKEKDNESENESESENENESVVVVNNNIKGSQAALDRDAAWRQNFVKVFNETVKESRIPPIRNLNEERMKKINTLLRLYTTRDLYECFLNASRSSFLNKGGVKNKFQATFDWLIEPQNFVKVLEGNYNS